MAEEKGLYIGAAPDTFLDSSDSELSKAFGRWLDRKAALRYRQYDVSGVETWHPSPRAFYAKGGGPLYDMAGYYLSTLICLFGPVEEVFAYSGKAFEKRRIYSKPLAGSTVKVEVPDPLHGGSENAKWRVGEHEYEL